MISSTSDYESNRIFASGASFQVGMDRERTKPVSFEEVEECFKEVMREPLSQASEIGEADIVVGIPFYNEVDTIATVLITVRKGLSDL